LGEKRDWSEVMAFHELSLSLRVWLVLFIGFGMSYTWIHPPSATPDQPPSVVRQSLTPQAKLIHLRHVPQSVPDPASAEILGSPEPPDPASPPPPPEPPAEGLPVQVTYYQALPGQTDITPDIAACGRNLRPWVQVALSRDLFYEGNRRRCGKRAKLRFPDGRVLRVVVNDTMNRRFRLRVDVLVHHHEPARAYGIDSARLEWE
jgi:hypothetical protein